MLDVFNEKARKFEEKKAAEKERQEILKKMDELFVAYGKHARELDELDKKFSNDVDKLDDESEEPVDKSRKLVTFVAKKIKLGGHRKKSK